MFSVLQILAVWFSTEELTGKIFFLSSSFIIHHSSSSLFVPPHILFLFLGQCTEWPVSNPSSAPTALSCLALLLTSPPSLLLYLPPFLLPSTPHSSPPFPLPCQPYQHSAPWLWEGIPAPSRIPNSLSRTRTLSPSSTPSTTFIHKPAVNPAHSLNPYTCLTPCQQPTHIPRPVLSPIHRHHASPSPTPQSRMRYWTGSAGFGFTSITLSSKSSLWRRWVSFRFCSVIYLFKYIQSVPIFRIQSCGPV